MPTQETMYQIGIELSELFVSGLLGGLVDHYLSLRLFKAQQRLGTQREFKLKRLEALRDIKIYLHCSMGIFLIIGKNLLTKSKVPKNICLN